jgi:A/G-specific adenine glycosylase
MPTADGVASGEPTVAWMRRRVLEWGRRHARDYVWRRSRDPYDVLLAELLLHRTRADLVEPLFLRLRSRYPNPRDLAQAEEEKLVELLRPLGYSHRSRRLPSLGRALVGRHGGRVPDGETELRALPGVGRYIANAVLAVAFGRRAPLLDPNVIRLLGRVFGVSSVRPRPRDDPMLWDFLAQLVPRTHPAEFGLALVDIGAVICLPRRPKCGRCPLRSRCRAFRSGSVTPAE